MIKFTKCDDITNTSLKGYISLTYKELVSIFGRPNGIYDPGDKVDWEWTFKLNFTPICIYNYKDGPNYTHKKVTAKSIEMWHIGALFLEDLKILEDYINQRTNNKFSDREFIKEWRVK